MAGRLIPLVPKRLVDFGALPVGGTQELVLADLVDVVPWTEITLLVRVHDHGLGSGAGSIEIRTRSQSWTPDDPGTVFLQPGYVATIILNNTLGTTAYLAADCNTNISPGTALASLARITAYGTRNAGGSLYARVSVDFSVKA